MPECSPVTFDTITARGGYRIGLLTLSRPDRHNALDLDMVKAIGRQMQRWERSKRVVAVVMRGQGERAFCAGGDLRKLYDSMTAGDDTRYQYADQFFTAEYQNNLNLHRFTKPLIAWGNGLVMGGGLGLYLCAAYRIGTPTLQMAWPEARIGLFPDVLASWYLPRLPAPLGWWLGATGASLGLADAKMARLVNYQLPHESWNSVVEDLRRLPWGDNRALNHYQVRQCLRTAEQDSPVMANEAVWPRASSVVELLRSGGGGLQVRHPDADVQRWLEEGVSHWQSASPMSLAVLERQLAIGWRQSWLEASQMELALAMNVCRQPDFREGIRAMLIDRDHQPAWQHACVAEVGEPLLRELFAAPWPAGKELLR